MCSLPRLFFERQTGSSFTILEVCGLRFRQFSGSGDHIFQQISTKSHVQIKFSNAEFVFNGEWNRKYTSDFRDVQIPDLNSIRYYVHNSSPFSPNFACGSEMWSFRRLLFVGQTGSSFAILEVCGFRFWQFSVSGDYIFQQISTKSHIRIKFSNADFVFNGEWKRK